MAERHAASVAIVIAVFAFGKLLSACGGTPNADRPAAADDAGGVIPDAGGPEVVSAPPVVVPPPSYPTVLANTGRVIAHPIVQPVVFAGDPLTNDIEAFYSKLATTSHFADSALEYGVGAITVRPIIVLSEQPEAIMVSEQIESWLAEKLSGSQTGFGVADENVQFALFYPESTVISQGLFSKSCEQFGGYHGSVTVPRGEAGTVSVGYAVIARCNYPSMTVLDMTTVAAQHELFEWATDPRYGDALSYWMVDDEHIAWADGASGAAELSDLCTIYDSRGQFTPPDLGYAIQTQWSNARAKAGQFPCVPARSTFMAYPEEPDQLRRLLPTLSGEMRSVTSKAIRVNRGSTRTVRVSMFADDPSAAGEWEVRAYLLPRPEAPTLANKYELKLNDGESATGKYGDELALTITADSHAVSQIAYLASYKHGDDRAGGFYVYPFRIASVDRD